MSDVAAAGAAPASPLDPRLRELLDELAPAHAAFIRELVLDRDRIVALAERRADRLQRLQEVSATLSRSLDRDDIERELARQVARAIACDGVVVARAPAAEGAPSVALHWRTGDVANPVDATPALAAIDEVARTARPSRLSAGASDEAAGAPAAVLAVPLMVGYKLAGILAVYGHEPGAIGGEEEELLRTLGATAGTALANAALFAESLHERRQSEALASLAGALGSSLRLGEALRLSLRHAAAILGASGAVVALRRGEFLHIVATTDGAVERIEGLYVPIAGSVMGRAVTEARALVFNAYPDDAYQRIRDLGDIEKLVVAPLLTPEGPVGVLCVANRDADFADDDARVLDRLAAQVALAVVNSRLYEEATEATRELRAAFDAIAGGMAVLDSEGFVTRHNGHLAALAGLPADHTLVGRSFFEALLREPRGVVADDPLGAAMLQRRVGRATIRQAWTGKVLDVVASPHPAGGAVVTVDDVTEFHALAERYRLVVESTTDAILITSTDGVIEFENEAASTLFGQRGPLTGTRLAALVPIEMEADLAGRMARAVRGDGVRFSGAVLRADGERRLVSMSLAPVRGGDPVTALVASLRDMSDEARARDEIAAANARYRNLVEVAADAIYTLDPRGVFTSVNAAAEELAGMTREALIGRSVLPLVDPSDTDEVARHLRAAAGGATRRYECHLRRAGGTQRLVSVSNTPIRRGPDVVGVLGVARDVTEERARAVALERAEARYTRLVESAEDAICTADEEGNLTSVNRALERVAGRSRESLIGTHFTDLIKPEERAEMWRAFAGTLGGQRRRCELRYTDAEGAPGIATVVMAPIYERGKINGVLAIVRDVTEERAILDQMVRREKLAALGELVGGVAHEVNSPLTSILAFGQILQSEGAAGDDARHAADTIVHEAKRAARIVGKLLTFARQNPPERMRTDLNQVVLDTIELRRYPLRLQEITLAVHLAEGLPVTWADPFQLQQVFINLLSTAEQALVGKPGERTITVRTERRGSELVISFADSGAGIAPEHLSHIFNPFYTTKPRGVGTGLGLSISFGIVREHGGVLRLVPGTGEGAAFEVALPIVDPPTQGNS